MAENLPAKPHRRHLWLCSAAPLLIAAGWSPRAHSSPTCARTPRSALPPDATAGHAISYERQYYIPRPPTCGPGCRPTTDLETAEDGTLPMSGHFDGYLYLTVKATGAPLAQQRPADTRVGLPWLKPTGLPPPENPCVLGRRVKNLPHGRKASSPRMALLDRCLHPPQVGFVPVGKKCPEKTCALKCTDII